MNLDGALSRLPDKKRAVVIVSGGLDSTIVLRLAKEKYGEENVAAITFWYGQKQACEIEFAQWACRGLDISHHLIDLNFLKLISKGFSANVDADIAVPDIKEVLGDPQPKTYVPNRNMIMLSIAAAYAEVNKYDIIVCGLQVHDLYGYYDTSQRFVDKINDVLAENRKNKIQIISPFSDLSKKQELDLLKEMDGNTNLAIRTFTCYNPPSSGIHCGKCASCAERIMNFAKFGEPDPAIYRIKIDWNALIEKHKETVPSVQ